MLLKRVTELQYLQAAVQKHAAQNGHAAPATVDLYSKVACVRMAAPDVADVVRGHMGITGRLQGRVSTVAMQGTGSYSYVDRSGAGVCDDVDDTWYGRVVAVMSYYAAEKHWDCLFVRYFATPEKGRFGPTMMRPLEWEAVHVRGKRLPSYAVIDMETVLGAVCICPDFANSGDEERFLLNHFINPFDTDSLQLGAGPVLVERVRAGICSDSEDE